MCWLCLEALLNPIVTCGIGCVMVIDFENLELENNGTSNYWRVFLMLIGYIVDGVKNVQMSFVGADHRLRS